MTYQLFPYQQDLVKRAQQAYKDGYKAPCIVLGCGGGKSIIIAEIIRQSTLKGNLVLFLVHRKELRDQIENTLIKNNVNMDLVTVGMVQTIVRRLDKLPKYNLVVIDENHHTLAASYKKIIDYFDTYVLGFTATPIRLNGDGLGDVNDLLIEGVSVDWMIKNNRLAPYDYYSIDLVDKDKLRKSSTGDYTSDSMGESLGDTIYGDVIKHYRQLADGQKTILYAHSVEYSKMYAEKFNEAGISSAHIDAKTPKAERDNIIQRFRDGEVLVLCNVDILGEGFDVPDATTVMLLRPTESLSLYIQQSMRPMRYRPNKRATIIDHVGNVYRHGFPDMARKWTLDKKPKRKKTEVDPFPIWECEIDADGCGMVFPKDDVPTVQVWNEERKEHLDYKQCPDCGELFLIEVNQGKQIDETAELKKLEKEQTETEFYKRRNWRKAKSYKELQEIGKAKGYKPSWSAFKAAELKLDDAPRWVFQYIQEPQFKLNF